MGEQVAAGSDPKRDAGGIQGSLTKVSVKGHSGGIAQLGEHLPCKQGVKGSNPSISRYLYNVLCSEAV